MRNLCDNIYRIRIIKFKQFLNYLPPEILLDPIITPALMSSRLDRESGIEFFIDKRKL
jgi:hypothetical protein